jgi:hypothetical protein
MVVPASAWLIHDPHLGDGRPADPLRERIEALEQVHSDDDEPESQFRPAFGYT